MSCHIFEQPFDPWQQLEQHQKNSNLAGQFGATATFVGTMRDLNEGNKVTQMSLEHYPAMTEQQLANLEQQARQKWDLLDSLIIHRVGDIHPSDPIVLIASWSAHRRAALAACDWLIESVKYQAPFWKKETLIDGERWVERNSDGL